MRASLERLRPSVDEVVIAVDACRDPGRLGDFAAVADRLVRFEFEGFVERALPWLHAQCSHEWILRIDGDEVPSNALVRQLPDLTARRDVLQYWLPRRLVFPDRRQWLREWPWWPDYQLRLFRNDPVMWTPGLLHTSIAQAWPACLLEDAVLYHLEAVLLPVATRETKRAAYAALDPGSTSEWLSKLPDRDARSEPVEVPLADVDAIAAVLDARHDGASARTPTVRLVTRREIDHHWPERSIDVSAYRGAIRILDRPRRLFAGEQACFRLLVRNDGAETWPGDERRPLIRLGHRWLDRFGRVALDVEARDDFPSQVRAGDESVLQVMVEGPPSPGRYLLEFDLVHEFVRWFQQPARLRLDVASRT